MSRWHWVLGLLAYLITLAVLAPAALLGNVASRYGNGRVLLEGPAGHLWNGRVERLSIRADHGPVLRLDQVRWRVSPDRLLSGQAPLWIESAGDLRLSGWVGPGGEAVRLSQFRFAAGLDVLSAHLPSLARLNLAGELRLDSQEISLGKPYAGKASGELRLDAGGAPGVPAGRYSLDLEGKGERLAIRWNGPQGPRAMSGMGWWDGRLQLEGVPGASQH